MPLRSPQRAPLRVALLTLGCGFLVPGPAEAQDSIGCLSEPTDMLVSYDVAVVCSIGVSGDSDLFRFQGNAGDTVIVGAIRADAGEVTPCLELIGPGVSQGGCSAAIGTRINVSLAFSGTFTILVRDHDIDTGAYTLTLNRVRPPAPNAGAVPYGQSVIGSLDVPGDIDIFAFAGTSGDRVSISAIRNNSQVSPCIDLWTPGERLSPSMSPISLSSSCSSSPDNQIELQLPETGVYTVEVRAFGNLATGAFSLSVQCLTGLCTSPALPLPPSELNASAIVGNVVTLRWTAPADGTVPSGFVVEGGLVPGQTLASLPTGSTAPVFTFTAPAGSFFIRVHTLSDSGRSRSSNEIRIHVGVPVAPSAPASLLGVANGSSVALAWNNTYNGGAPDALVLDVSGSITTSIPLGLSESVGFASVPRGTYTMALRAVNAAGSSLPSNSLTLTFPSACSGAPQPPENFLAHRMGSTIVAIWDPPSSGPAPTGYVLTIAGGFGGSFATTAQTLSGTVGPGTYVLSLTASNPCGVSTATPAQTVIVP